MSAQSALLRHFFRALGAVALLGIEAALPGQHTAGLGSYGRVGSKLTPRGSESEWRVWRALQSLLRRPLHAHYPPIASDQIPSATRSGQTVR
jgi:hypothetical protein